MCYFYKVLIVLSIFNIATLLYIFLKYNPTKLIKNCNSLNINWTQIHLLKCDVIVYSFILAFSGCSVEAHFLCTSDRIMVGIGSYIMFNLSVFCNRRIEKINEFNEYLIQ